MKVKVQNENTMIKKFISACKKIAIVPILVETIKEKIDTRIIREYNIYDVDIPTSDWTVVKKFDHEDKIIKKINSSDDAHDELVNECKCDACKKNIHRKFTYLLRNSKGEYVQVGAGCVSKYIPNISRNYEYYLKFIEDMSDSEFESPDWTDSDQFDSEYALRVALEHFIDTGYNYKAFKHVFTKQDLFKNEDFPSEITNKAEELARKIIEFIKTYNGNNDYILNLKKMSNGSFALRNYKLWCSAVTLYDKIDVQDKPVNYNTEGLPRGKQTVRIVRFIKTIVKTYTLYDGYYGFDSYKVHLVDSNNNYIVLSMTNPDKVDELINNLKNGNVDVTLTIKDSSEYNGILYNFGTRAKF